MTEQAYDVLGIGNAIVDVLAHASDEFLVENGIAKGAMTLIDAEAATGLYGKMGPAVEVSGGSAANTIAGLASLGAKTAFIGKVKNDQLGEVFAHDIRALGVAFDTEPASDGPPTARCLILVTPDAQRSMNTFLGASSGLGPEDVIADQVQSAKITYLEGYLWDPPRAKEAFVKAAGLAHAAGQKVSLTLSDAFCVDRYRDEFKNLVRDEIDILFANEAEIMSLYEVDTFDEALQAVRQNCHLTALTRSEAGSVIVSGDEIHVVDADKVDEVVDSTGAGDQFAAGFLYGLATGRSLVDAARIGSVTAGEVIGHLGPRPECNLAELVKAKGI